MRPRLLIAAACFVASLVFVGVLGASSHRTLDRATADRPDEAIGPQVHAIYAVPSDAPDGGLDTNGSFGSWLNLFNNWLADRSGGVRLRLDTFQGAPDVSFLRLSDSSSSLGEPGAAYLAVRRAVSDAGFIDPTKKYVVAVAAGGDPVCGIGGGNTAVVFVSQCTNVSEVFVAGHEIFHTLGAVADCAAHQTGDGHTSDATDLMAPYAQPLGSTPTLDPGHDDYWAPANDAHLPAACSASANIANSEWLTSKTYYRLTVHSGSDGVASVRPENSFSEDCAPDCVETGEPGARYLLSATPHAGYRFTGWTGGGCDGADCTFTLNATTTLAASFAHEPELALALKGKGRVTVPNLAAVCTVTCSLTFSYGKASVLREQPAKGWRFAGWGGSCHGAATACTLSLTADGQASATFAQLKLCARGKKSTARHPCRPR